MTRTAAPARRKRPVIALDPGTARNRPPRSRNGRTVRFEVGGVRGHLITNAYPDGRLGEIWVRVDEASSPLNGFLDVLSAAVSIGLQHGVPLEQYVTKYVGTRFDPCGPVSDPDIGHASSLPDYLFRRLALDHLDEATRLRLGVRTPAELDLAPEDSP
ncbi:TSCPD domain-containing protein [Saccharopolyspora rosea]|uniref:ribonucleoside-diphosphate reductase n=1 Tax=Saccharopolyspora rosea TaxID=524884 RepID=A0ABW3FXG8_9PSEU|nr:hypothetical protein [Saccharopolyspora rosea]